jgi:hypothetical protein
MKPPDRKVLRCAIYTRKSTEHNLDQLARCSAGGLRGVYKESGP